MNETIKGIWIIIPIFESSYNDGIEQTAYMDRGLPPARIWHLFHCSLYSSFTSQ
jgi:hypothetical protein